MCKSMVSFVIDSIITHIREQYGFINGRSTMTLLLSYVDKCIDTIVVSGRVVDTIYDLAKAFDSIPHNRLLGKLKSYGINGKVSEWIKSCVRYIFASLFFNSKRKYL